jgi:hypothetical protein
MYGTTMASTSAKLVSLGWVVERDATLVQLADMSAGWMPYRARHRISVELQAL